MPKVASNVLYHLSSDAAKEIFFKTVKIVNLSSKPCNVPLFVIWMLFLTSSFQSKV